MPSLAAPINIANEGDSVTNASTSHPTNQSSTRQRVLVIGKSPVVLSEAERLLGDLGFSASSTDRFEDVPKDFDVSALDLVVFGGRVPPAIKVQLRQIITVARPDAFFVDGLAGIPGLIVQQVRGALAAKSDASIEQTHTVDHRSVSIELLRAARVTVTLWWGTSFVPPNPGSDSRVLLDASLAAGTHEVHVPSDIPNEVAFATVDVDGSVEAFPLLSIE
jgi:hypothetical protein